ncbi:MAG: hypothetical protein U1F76_11585 [Candidatus Competibacteraceae bacterium]
MKKISLVLLLLGFANVFFPFHALGETLDELKAKIDNLNKEIQYLESQLPKAATTEERRKLRYSIEEKQENLEYNKIIHETMLNFEGKNPIDGFDLVETVTVNIANFYKKKGLLLDDKEIFSKISELLKQREVIIEGKLSPYYRYQIVGEKSKGVNQPFSFEQIVNSDQDAINKFYIIFSLITPLKPQDLSRLQNALKMQKTIVVEGIITDCERGVCKLDQWVVKQ